MSAVILTASDGLARIMLDGPHALHALATDVCVNMKGALRSWRDDEDVRAVLIQHQPGTRGSCAGGETSCDRR